MSGIVEPREQESVMASDWNWILSTLKMVRDRALTGTPLHLRRPSGWPATADIKYTMRNGVMRIVDDIFSTAVVDESEEHSHAPKSAP